MAKEMTGHCLCGNVTYEITEEPVAQAFCYCQDCQRQTSSPFSVVIGVPVEGFKVEGESLSSIVTQGEVHGGPTRRYFCSACGSPIYSAVEAMPDVIYVKAGTLDDASWLQPHAEVFTRSAMPWAPHLEGAPRFETMPGV
jgi:hypothetical protein